MAVRILVCRVLRSKTNYTGYIPQYHSMLLHSFRDHAGKGIHVHLVQIQSCGKTEDGAFGDRISTIGFTIGALSRVGPALTQRLREGKSDDVIDRPASQLVYGDKARQEGYARSGRAELIAVRRRHPIAMVGGNIVHASAPICPPFIHTLPAEFTTFAPVFRTRQNSHIFPVDG